MTDGGIETVLIFQQGFDGGLPSGQSLAEALAQVDGETAAGPAYYMINFPHPTHFEAILADASIRERVRGLRANASTLSHAELDEAAELDASDPADLATHYAGLIGDLPNLNVFGGCCGTDRRHVAAIAGAVAP